MGQKVYLTQAKKISFVETGKNAEYTIWGARKKYLKTFPMVVVMIHDISVKVRTKTASLLGLSSQPEVA